MRWRDFQREAEAAYWRARLKQSGGCIARAARLAGVGRQQVYKALRRCGVPIPQRKADRVPVDIRQALRRFLS